MVVILGANGQLGKILKEELSIYDLIGFSRNELDVTDFASLEQHLSNLSAGDFIINASAYTNVDGAESEKEIAMAVNNDALKHLRELSIKKNLNLIHVSTDYVFDGEASGPINENTPKKSLGVYGESKSQGEDQLLLQDEFNDYSIIRTSWLYSEYNRNFLKTMVSLKDKEELRVVSDQMGTPTYARHLARVIKVIIENFDKARGEVFHYSNEGVASWHEFASEIFEQIGAGVIVHPIPSEEYPTAASRPKYSVLDKNKIIERFGIEIPHWKEGLRECLKKLSY